ncbi:MAG: ATP-grasp domain-containing protein [Patescibacteria group bacterium]
MASIVYVTRDIERALGKTPEGDYFIVANKTPYAEEIKTQFPHNILLIDSPETLDTLELLAHAEVESFIAKLSASILVFKNTKAIEALAEEKGWDLLNPSSELAEKVENKITQVEWLGELAELLPPHQILLTKNITWEKSPFILQWAHSHTGDGTLLIQNEKDLAALQTAFPDREARVTQFIKGPMFTVNLVVTDKPLLMGNISYQITGILPFTENPFSTIGNDWSLPPTILTPEHLETIKNIAEKVGQKMQADGWRGLFGIDVIHDEERDALHLIEINARQPASTTFESQLQEKNREAGVPGLTTFEAHLLALTRTTTIIPLIEINDGAQIVQRVTVRTKTAQAFSHPSYTTITYQNPKLNADLLRIQSDRGIMETHMKFNARGKEVIELLA